MGKATHWFILNVRTGRELFAHELVERAGRKSYAEESRFEVYTPFETKHQAIRSRKARREQQRPKPYADPLFQGYLFVGANMGYGEALVSLDYVIGNNKDFYSVMSDHGKPVVLNQVHMDGWKASLQEAHKGKERYVLRGYDSKRDARKNLTRLYGQDIITLPTFTKGDIVKFMDGSFQSILAQVDAVDFETVHVLANILGRETRIKVDDPFLLAKAG